MNPNQKRLLKYNSMGLPGTWVQSCMGSFPLLLPFFPPNILISIFSYLFIAWKWWKISLRNWYSFIAGHETACSKNFQLPVRRLSTSVHFLFFPSFSLFIPLLSSFLALVLLSFLLSVSLLFCLVLPSLFLSLLLDVLVFLFPVCLVSLLRVVLFYPHIFICYLYVARMYSYVTRMLPVCTRLYSYIISVYPYVIVSYSYVLVWCFSHDP